MPLSVHVWVKLVRMRLIERDWRPSRYRGVPEGWWYRLTEAGEREKAMILARDQSAALQFW